MYQSFRSQGVTDQSLSGDGAHSECLERQSSKALEEDRSLFDKSSCSISKKAIKDLSKKLCELSESKTGNIMHSSF
jgi:hypothetical protein